MSSILVRAAVALLVAVPVAFAAPRSEPIQPIVAAPAANPALVELGKQLFFDPRLSKSGFISCNSCHNLSTGGVDNLKSSIGHAWHQGPINSPTVLNAGYNVAQFWDGRAKDLQEQAAGPIANPGEMASSHALAVDVLKSIPGYAPAFRSAFGSEGIDLERVTRAIAAFESTLVTPNSRFDRWLRGDDRALTADERAGYALFRDGGCAGCHSGPAAGGGSFQKLGVVQPYATRNPAVGREGVTHDPADRMVFKVPTLRNVELTYPYFHDGEQATLEDAVRTMAHVQLGRDFTPAEVGQVVAFLKTLTGEQPRLVLPVLPPSGPRTPQPQPFG
jgi:cytochrome c peroxidase